MKTSTIWSAFATILLLLFTACSSEAQDTKQNPKTVNKATIEVIQFHSAHRCKTCNLIESLTRETLTSFGDIPFLLVNVDERKNEKMATEFEATGTALFLYNPKTGNKKDLTDFAFMQAGNKDKFIAGLKKEIELFLHP